MVGKRPSNCFLSSTRIGGLTKPSSRAHIAKESSEALAYPTNEHISTISGLSHSTAQALRDSCFWTTKQLAVRHRSTRDTIHNLKNGKHDAESQELPSKPIASGYHATA